MALPTIYSTHVTPNYYGPEPNDDLSHTVTWYNRHIWIMIGEECFMFPYPVPDVIEVVPPPFIDARWLLYAQVHMQIYRESEIKDDLPIFKYNPGPGNRWNEFWLAPPEK